LTTKPKNSRVRVLVVEDHDPFRHHVCSVLESYAHLQVIGTSDDGPKAVQQARGLQPDIILLDIGLPGINGLEAARQINAVSPQAKIIFLTQESSAEVVEEALSLGAWGYVLKPYAGSELVAAIDAVSKGQRFLSRGLEVNAISPKRA
jgi:DNA-binding NarL/FixJ family response regulator